MAYANNLPPTQAEKAHTQSDSNRSPLLMAWQLLANITTSEAQAELQALKLALWDNLAFAMKRLGLKSVSTIRQAITI